MNAPPLLEARALSVTRGGTPVLRGIDFALRPGDAVAIIGPNGAGKSTLLRALSGLLPAAGGEVRLSGRRLDEWPRAALARSLALVLPEDHGARALSVAESVALGRYPHRGPLRPLSGADRVAIRTALDRAGVTALALRRLDMLSAGERQLANLARGLAQQPEALLLDEPAAHLDVGHQLRLFRVLDEARSSGVAILAVVHDLQRAAAWARRLLLLAGGSVVAQGTAAEVLASPDCARAFGVSIRGHVVPGVSHPLYTFEQRDPEPNAPQRSLPLGA